MAKFWNKDTHEVIDIADDDPAYDRIADSGEWETDSEHDDRRDDEADDAAEDFKTDWDKKDKLAEEELEESYDEQ